MDTERKFNPKRMKETREDRIAFMSDAYDRLRRLVTELAEKTEELDAMLPEVEKLQEYVESGRWLQDFEADERGEVPLEVSRSVLSEDGLYDLLSDLNELYGAFGRMMEKITGSR